jgi:hypothetical protein
MCTVLLLPGGNPTADYISIYSLYVDAVIVLSRYVICRSGIIIVCILLGISPASDCDLPTFRNPLSVSSSKALCIVMSGC